MKEILQIIKSEVRAGHGADNNNPSLIKMDRSDETYTRPPKTPGGSFLRFVQEGLFGFGVS